MAKKIIGCILMSMVVMFILSSYNSLLPNFRTPDENCNYIFSLLYAHNGALSYEDDLSGISINTSIPTSARIVDNGKIVPGKFIGFPLYYGTFMSVIGDKSINYLTPIFASVGVLFIFVLARSLFGQLNGMISAIFLIFFPPYWFWSNFLLFETIFGAILYIISLNYIIKSLEEKRLVYYELAALFMGATINIRPDLVLLFIPLSILVAMNSKNIKISYLLIAILMFLIVVSMTFFMNNTLYGGWLKIGVTGDPINGVTSSTGLLASSLNATTRDISSLLPNIEYYMSISPIFFIAIAIYSVLFAIKTENNRYYLFFIILCYLMYFILFETYSLHDWDIHQGWPPLLQSFIRYILPILLASIPIFSLFLQRLSRANNKLVILSIVFIIITANVLLVLSQQGLSSIWDVREEERFISKNILENTEPNSILFIGRLDRAIYPARRVLSLTRFTQETDDEKMSAMVLVAQSLLDRDIPVYIYDYIGDPKFKDISAIKKKFMQSNLTIISRKDLGESGRLFKIDYYI